MGLFEPEISIGLTGFCVNEGHARDQVTVEFFERHVLFLESVFQVQGIKSGVKNLNIDLKISSGKLT
jgi:hypothetical protein